MVQASGPPNGLSGAAFELRWRVGPDVRNGSTCEVAARFGHVRLARVSGRDTRKPEMPGLGETAPCTRVNRHGAARAGTQPLATSRLRKPPVHTGGFGARAPIPWPLTPRGPIGPDNLAGSWRLHRELDY